MNNHFVSLKYNVANKLNCGLSCVKYSSFCNLDERRCDTVRAPDNRQTSDEEIQLYKQNLK